MTLLMLTADHWSEAYIRNCDAQSFRVGVLRLICKDLCYSARGATVRALPRRYVWKKMASRCWVDARLLPSYRCGKAKYVPAAQLKRCGNVSTFTSLLACCTPVRWFSVWCLIQNIQMCELISPWGMLISTMKWMNRLNTKHQLHHRTVSATSALDSGFSFKRNPLIKYNGMDV